MSILNKLMDTMRLTEEDDDDYFIDDDYEDEKPAKKRLFNKKEEEDYDYDEEPEPKPRFLSRSSSKVVPMRRGMEVTLIKPTSMEDSREICDYLLAGKAVVLNMEGIHMEVAQRIIDFTSGSCYAINGSLQKVSSYIFILTPADVDITGDFQEILSGAFDFPSIRTEF